MQCVNVFLIKSDQGQGITEEELYENEKVNCGHRTQTEKKIGEMMM